jgi:AcrR family transcriptional regulator
MARPGARSAKSSATERILEAAARQIVRGGTSALALSDIARDAGVSKALIHYHFQDKETLLARLVDHLATGLVAREREALAPYERQHNPLAVDAVWQWLEGELRRGDIRVLVELNTYREPSVQLAVRSAATRRREAARQTVEQLFAILELRPRIEPTLLARVLLAFVDGLALDIGIVVGEENADLSPDAATARVAFDVFWLAMLSLAE